MAGVCTLCDWDAVSDAVDHKFCRPEDSSAACPSRWGNYYCVYVAGHEGEHAAYSVAQGPISWHDRHAWNDESVNAAGDQLRREKEKRMVRAKFTVQEITQYSWNKDSVRIKLAPQYDTTIPEDQRFSKATPNGEFWMQVDNPAAAAQLELGKTYYIDLTPAEETV